MGGGKRGGEVQDARKGAEGEMVRRGWTELGRGGGSPGKIFPRGGAREGKGWGEDGKV